eukprot:COSAG04_NODE_25338_length_309_cov_0.604762_1_plen_22_part_10
MLVTSPAVSDSLRPPPRRRFQR